MMNPAQRMKIGGTLLAVAMVFAGTADAHGGRYGGTKHDGMRVHHGSPMRSGIGMHGADCSMSGRGGMHGAHAGELDDEDLDRIGEHIGSMYRRMQEIAEAEDAGTRRELVREHLAAMHEFTHERHERMRQRQRAARPGVERRQQMAERMESMMESRLDRIEQMMIEHMDRLMERMEQRQD